MFQGSYALLRCSSVNISCASFIDRGGFLLASHQNKLPLAKLLVIALSWILTFKMLSGALGVFFS